jgi:hypothetical protein
MTRATVYHALAFCLSACALLSGCAAPGDPSPRHPVVPLPVADLAGRQSGSEVVLTFSVPTRSTDREDLTEAPAIEIFRAALPPGASADRKTAWRQVYTIPSERVDSYIKDSHFEFRDPLTPDDLSHAPGSSMAYMVRTRAVKARASDDSNIFAARIFPPPEAPRDLRVSVTEAAIVVGWAESSRPSGATSGGYRVYRAEIESGQEPAPQDLSQVKLKSPIGLAGPSSSTEFSDSHFEFGKTYFYTIRSVAQFGADSVESADAAPVIITPRATFPPAAPRGLESAIIPATPQAPAYVELSWAISSEGDLAGYYVYRSDSEDTPGERINSEILPSPAFRDISVVPGRRYFYRVSAVDRAGNESPKSSPVQVEVPLSGQ